MKNFNLNKFNKKAFYEGGKGQTQRQTRAMMNCYKAKLDAGKSAQDAWESCLNEYGDKDQADWALKYAQNAKK